jgi:hypothetical protein
MNRWVAASFLLPLLALGCGNPDIGKIIGAQFPTIGRIAIGDAIHETPIEFSVQTFAPANSESNVFVSEVLAAYRSTSQPNLPFIEVAVLTQGATNGNATTWSGSLPALPLGRYELRVQPRVKYQPQAPDQTPVDEQPGLLMEATAFFSVGPSESCYGFAADTEGWTLDGIFDIQETEENPQGVLTTLPLLCDGLVVLNGAALLPMGSGCVPSPPIEPVSGNWALDFVSPDLSDLEPWQGLETVLFSILAEIPVKVQPILKVVDPDGAEHTYAPVNGQGAWIFYDVDDDVRVIEWSPTFPAGSTVTEFRVRVFVNLFESGGGINIFTRLFAVCPVGP